MHDPSYYRDLARRARRLATEVSNVQFAERLERAARDFDETAEDLETGAVELRHPGLVRQNDG
jgi:hypothetical protein